MRPAHKTKHLPVLDIPFGPHSFTLYQSDDGTANGTTLWLGAQCLSLYLHDWVARSRLPRPPRVIELGAGVGLTRFGTSLVLAAQGCHVLTTDISHVVRSVLVPTVSANAPSFHDGTVRVRELDWTVPPDQWSWSNEHYIATHHPNSVVSEPHHSSIAFDLIVTSDTVYIPHLVQPLLRTLHHLCTHSATRPVVYLAVERRDPALLATTLASAKSDWGFSVTPLSHRKLSNAMKRTDWPKEEWSGIEIYKLVLPRSMHSDSQSSNFS